MRLPNTEHPSNISYPQTIDELKRRKEEDPRFELKELSINEMTMDEVADMLSPILDALDSANVPWCFHGMFGVLLQRLVGNENVEVGFVTHDVDIMIPVDQMDIVSKALEFCLIRPVREDTESERQQSEFGKVYESVGYSSYVVQRKDENGENKWYKVGDITARTSMYLSTQPEYMNDQYKVLLGDLSEDGETISTDLGHSDENKPSRQMVKLDELDFGSRKVKVMPAFIVYLKHLIDERRLNDLEGQPKIYAMRQMANSMRPTRENS